MLDGDALLYQLLQTGLGSGITVKPDLEVDAIDHFPYVTFSSIGGASINAGGATAPRAWTWELDVNVFHDDLDDVKAVARQVYDLVHSWNDAFGTAHIIEGLGHATAVTDRSLFSKVGSADLDGHTITQLAGGWSLQLHQE